MIFYKLAISFAIICLIVPMRCDTSNETGSDSNSVDVDKRYRVYGKRMSSGELLEELLQKYHANEDGDSNTFEKRYRVYGKRFRPDDLEKRYRVYGKRYRVYG